MPYVDASAASAFAQRRHRIAVSAAGIMTELALAAVALPLWLWLDEGLLRDAAFVTLVITGVSTLLFNANPLQRLDGYYIVTDALELPNLAPRSRRWWQELLQRRLLRLPGVEPMPVARGETPWLAAYAPLAWLVVIAISALAVVWLGQLSLMLGVLCGLLLAWQILLRPAAKLIGQLRRSALAQQGTAMRWRRLALGGSAALLLALLVPLPQRTLVQGVVWPPDQAQLRADEDGFVAAVAAPQGQTVQPGQLVVQLANPTLQASRERQVARVVALETNLFHALPGDGESVGNARAGDARAELVAAQAELARLDERIDALAVRARTAGRVALPQSSDLHGQYIRRGRLLGQVIGDEAVIVRLALPESQASDLRREVGAVSVQLASAPGSSQHATLVRDSVGAVMQLPSAALSTRHGGDVTTDPRDSDDLKPLQPVVLLDVRLDAQAQSAPAAGSDRIGERAWVRFDTGLAPLAWQLAKGLQGIVLRRFNPQF